MYIRRVVIKNFRNLQNIDVSMEDGLTCVVGENNSGKTNFLLALRLALDVNLPSYIRTISQEDFSHGIDISTPQQVFVGVEITGFYDKERDEKVKELALAQEWAVEEDVARICYRFRPKPLVRQAIESGEHEGEGLTIEDYEYELVGGAVTDENGNLKDLNAIEWDDDFHVFVKIGRLAAFRLVYLPAIRDVEEDLRRLATSPLYKLLDVIDLSQEKKDELIELIKKANDEVSSQSEIKNLAVDINTALEGAVGPVFKLDVGLGMSSPTFVAIARALRILLSGQGLKDADPSRNGLGLNNILYVSMLLSYFEKRMEQDDTAGQLLLIEEPEAHLHPQLQRILFGRLLSRDCQIVATTHSTHITSRADLKNLLILTPDREATVSACRPTMNPDIEGKVISDLERYLDATKSALLFARGVILVEGMSEVFLIPKMVKKVKGIDLEEHGISIIPIYGVHFNSYLKLFGADGIRKKCAVLTDGDLQPSDAEKVEKMEFPRVDDLKVHESDFIKVFHCETTFEHAIAEPANLKAYAKAAEELGAHNVSAELMSYFEQKGELKEAQRNESREKVLNTSRRFGKARFAQVASKYVDDIEILPRYIEEAVVWVTE